MIMASYIVATTKPWNLREYSRFASQAKGAWHLIERPEDLTVEAIRGIKPRYVFFPHWHWKIPREICDAAECVLFHMTDLPFGRGGSPLQNLIVCGFTRTMVSAIRVVPEVDAGPVYLKRPLSLDGSAAEIFARLSRLVFEMIAQIVAEEPSSTPQSGDPVYFKRRTPAQSVLPVSATLSQLYDHIRMLDAETYPAAFLEFGDWRFEFSKARLAEAGLEARVLIRARKNPE